MTRRVLVLGAGKIGRALALMLNEVDGITVTLGDTVGNDVEHVAVDPTNGVDQAFFSRFDAVVNALPHRLNIAVASSAKRAGIAYFDFSEDVASTEYVKSIATSTGSTMMPQCGLAPGMVNIVAASLIRGFDEPISAELRVGALPLTASNAMKYHLSWSTAGLVNEYIRPCDAIVGGEVVKLQALEGHEEVVVDGVLYEAFNTSGGLATMAESYLGKIDRLDYKTLRYPGHAAHMRFLMRDLHLDRRPELLEQILDQEVAVVDDDVVIVHVAVTGRRGGRLVRDAWTRKIRPLEVGGEHLAAIRASTASGMAAMLELWSKDQILGGFVRQEDINLPDALATLWGGRVWG